MKFLPHTRLKHQTTIFTSQGQTHGLHTQFFEHEHFYNNYSETRNFIGHARASQKGDIAFPGQDSVIYTLRMLLDFWKMENAFAPGSTFYTFRKSRKIQRDGPRYPGQKTFWYSFNLLE